ncbi:MAG: hypothetical protein EAZ55_12620 [Cytophagales bacterium]|nr:MAG: hypothetical protein EAZ55_12620 [Cytophagales bacterium]
MFFIAPTLLAQDFLKAYLYSLTNNDVKKALDDKDFLEQFIKEKRLPIDSSLVKDFSKQKLANGYYVIQNVYSDRSEYLMHSVMPFEIRFLDNDTDLLILLADSSKQPITDAKLYLKGKEIPLDPTTNLHKIAKTRKEGKLEIIYQGVVFYYILDNQLPKLRYYQTGFYGLLFFKLPTKYVLRPPLWLLRGLYVLCTKGRTRVLTYPFTKVWNRIFRRDYYYYGDNDRYHKSYIATNKYFGRQLYSRKMVSLTMVK